MQRDRIRQDPVSCQLCRSKKLRCNRVQPCSNCVARGKPCQFLVPPRRPSAVSSIAHSNEELLKRIELLESVISRQNRAVEIQAPDETSARQQPSRSLPEQVIIPGADQQRDHDAHLLENVGTREDGLLRHLSNGLTFKIDTTYHIIENRPASQAEEIVVIFPELRIATLLFQSYDTNLDHLYRIIHIPTVKALIRVFYLRLSQNERVPPGQAALLLSIFAVSAYFYQPLPDSEIASTHQEAIRLSKNLSKGALDILGYSRRNTSGTLEDVQAYIFMSFVTYHLDGFSARGRLLTVTAFAIARELRLHQLDADNESISPENAKDIRFLIDLEVKRRVFWHIVSTDWLFSTISGPQEGTYLIQPKHINVNLPSESTDDELILGRGYENTSGLLHSSMAFSLERIRLAQLCREMADTVPLETSKLLQMPYEHIISLDKKLQDYTSTLPLFFKLDSESRSRARPLELICPKIPVLRYCITTEAHSRRCKLHQRFLHRQTLSPEYSYSRRACLESARVVIQAYEDLRERDSQSTVPELMGMAVHFTHLALVVMVMDLCFNRDDADEEKVKAEVKAALQMFEDTRNPSPLLSRILSSLSAVLQKHEVNLDDSLGTMNEGPADLSTEMSLDPFQDPSSDDRMLSSQLGLDTPYLDVNVEMSFDEFWQTSMQGEMNSDLLSWDHLFSSLDRHHL